MITKDLISRAIDAGLITFGQTNGRTTAYFKALPGMGFGISVELPNQPAAKLSKSAVSSILMDLIGPRCLWEQEVRAELGLHKLWLRLGTTLYVTEEEGNAIIGGNTDILVKVIKDGRATPDGDSYIPETAVTDFKEQLSPEAGATAFAADPADDGEVNFDLSPELFY